MSHYEDMAATALAARDNWFRRNRLCQTFLLRLYLGFAEYCNVPDGYLSYMPWDESEQAYKMDGNEYVVPPMRYIEEDDEWAVGLYLRLNPKNHFPGMNVRFGVFVTEKDTRVVVRTGKEPSTVRTLDVNNMTELADYYDFLIKTITETFKSKPNQRARLGFQFELPAPPVDAPEQS